MNVCGSVVISMCVCASCVCVVGLTQCVCQSVYRLFVRCLLLVMQMSGEKSNSLFREGEQGCVSEGERLKRAGRPRQMPASQSFVGETGTKNYKDPRGGCCCGAAK